jgi:hypothetical protein
MRRVAAAGSLPEPESQVALGWDSAKTARSAANTIIVLQTPALILINLQLFGRRCRELLFVLVCGLTATLTSEVRNYWRDGLTEFGLEQTMLAL